MIQPGDTILFQGDSITDAGRVRPQIDPAPDNKPHLLGHGYANIAAARTLSERPGDDLKFHNRGISGNRITDIYTRWKADAIKLQPNVISILIGVNDTWHEFMYGTGVEVPIYERFYRELLELTIEKLPKVRLVLCEPFCTRTGHVTDQWVPDIQARQGIVRRLCDEYHAIHVPFQAMFDAACEEAPAEYWAQDGVHPTPAGFHRMAHLWCDTVTGKA